MGADYIPEADLKAARWMRSFAHQLATHPEMYMVSQADAELIAQATQQFRDALAVALRPSTRTSVSVAVKDQLRFSAQQLCRGYAQRIKFNHGISDPDKLAAGVQPINPRRRPIPCPETIPLLGYQGTANRQHALTYADIWSPNRRAKPHGAAYLELVRVVDDVPARDPNQAHPCALCTKTPFSVPLDPAHDGKIVTYFGRWVSRRGERGPWSQPLSRRVAA